MLPSVLSLALGATMANGLALRGSGCELHFTASGSVEGNVGEISSGQVRAGSGVDSTTFELKDGGLIDPNGKGCWWTRKLFFFFFLPSLCLSLLGQHG